MTHPVDAAPDDAPIRPLWLFDDGLGRFGPLTDLRPAFELPAGGRTLRRRQEGRLGRRAAAVWVPGGLAALQAEREAGAGGGAAVNPEAPPEGAVLAVNGRWDGLDAAVARRLAGLGVGEALVDADGAVLGVVAAAAAAAAWAASGFAGVPEGCRAAGRLGEAAAVRRPWDLLDRLALGLAVDADAWLPGGPDEDDPARGEGVHAHPEASIHPSAVIDGGAGPVVIEAGAAVQALAVIIGPVWIGRGVVVAPHTQLRGPVALGLGGKVGGEVKAAIVGAHSNKAHGGYLGDAVVGAWCNFGAGTTASNLKNTYGPVRVKLAADADREDTGRSSQGPIVGDFVKTAIGTRLPTGCCVGTGACLAGSAIAPSFVPPMTFTTDAGPAAMREEAFLTAVGRQLARRDRTPGPALAARLRALLRGSG
ncbi:putative sugar nucleotidyl transferase [Phycisphaera mikurensis]|uniref:Putative acetyltransferase n=1 Tax=Phycisphaera mikurensis (strain NBRC 102666 / KCTC 22515 / FYK2301M01) TaxID=1142394 RepID=I0IJC4_PHYMF|nr:putative sugar nucleotidyl transferase [Phycisphaera mikurensis]MBB6441839.1 UDP-N-acetylglucosamine diphosphorylase/glucosamine-1-phosphate N-acetyltransferase [Phycisphaera mikurensis]BAM05362.1 putative acetyltransferase [Phycisphaera mikurensis NBRC 102666]